MDLTAARHQGASSFFFDQREPLLDPPPYLLFSSFFSLSDVKFVPFLCKALGFSGMCLVVTM